MIITTEFDNDL